MFSKVGPSPVKSSGVSSFMGGRGSNGISADRSQLSPEQIMNSISPVKNGRPLLLPLSPDLIKEKDINQFAFTNQNKKKEDITRN